MRNNILKMISVLLILTMAFGAVACNKADKAKTSDMPMIEDGKGLEEGTESVSAEEAGMSDPTKDTPSATFKPADYTIGAKDEYVYEFMGLKFKLTDEFKKAMVNKEVAMLDDQSPLDQELKYAMLTFDRLTEEQRNAEVPQMGDGFMNWIQSLERLGTISMFKKGTSQEEISKITKADKHELIGTSKDGEYEYYLSTNEKTDDELLKEFKNTNVEVIDKKDRPENGFVLAEKTDLQGDQILDNSSAKDLKNLKTKDINGKDFDIEDFGDYELTMVNVFATWCTACVKEIPDLEKVYKEMKDKGVNIVGVVTDTVDDRGENAEAIEKSKLIQEKTKASYPFLMPDKTNFNGRLNGIQALPETFFVDKEGNIVGETYSGSRTAEGWKKVIEDELAKIRNK